MEITLTKLYFNYPVHFNSYEIIDSKLRMTFINDKLGNIKTIFVLINQKKIQFDINSSEKFIEVSIDLQNSNILSKPQLISCVINDEEYKRIDYPDFINIAQPKSVYTLGIERFLYKQKAAKALNTTVDKIQYIATQNDYFWSCTCGQSNFESDHVCRSCGTSRELLFSADLSTERAAIETDIEMKFNTNILIWTLLIYLLHIAAQVFYGDFLFENYVKNELFGVFNRFLSPLIVFLTTIGIIYTQSKYMLKLNLALKITRLLSIIYLNFVLAFFFVLTAYNFIFVIALDFVLLVYVFIKSFRSFSKFYEYVSVGVTCILLVFSIFQFTRFSGYTMIINPSGIYLEVETQAETYRIPETIDHIPVYEVYFNLNFDYKIKHLIISENLKVFSIYSTAVLPDLETIAVHENNQYFDIVDNILYHQVDGTIKLVPMIIEEIEINTPYIRAGSLKDNYNLVSVILGENVVTIEKEAFANNLALENVQFVENSKLKIIEAHAFLNCKSLTSIDLPITIEKIGLGIFEGCDSLVSLRMPFIGEEREVTNELSESHDILAYQFGSRTYLDYYLIPDSLKYVEIYDIDRIHNVTFYGAKHIEQITMEGDFISLGIRSFYNCESLEEFIIPEGVEIINESAFENCLNLSYLVIPASVTTIEKNAFLNCGLDEVIYLGDINQLEINAKGNDNLRIALGLE